VCEVAELRREEGVAALNRDRLPQEGASSGQGTGRESPWRAWTQSTAVTRIAVAPA
jgi:hypothetical protein